MSLTATAQNQIFHNWIQELGNQIIRIRKENGLTQQEFAKKLAISQSVVAKIEKGQNMTCFTLWKVGKALKVAPKIILEKENTEEGNENSLIQNFPPITNSTWMTP